MHSPSNSQQGKDKSHNQKFQLLEKKLDEILTENRDFDKRSQLLTANIQGEKKSVLILAGRNKELESEISWLKNEILQEKEKGRMDDFENSRALSCVGLFSMILGAFLSWYFLSLSLNRNLRQSIIV